MLPRNSQDQIHDNSEIIRILNPISEDKSDLRASMVCSMLRHINIIKADRQPVYDFMNQEKYILITKVEKLQKLIYLPE